MTTPDSRATHLILVRHGQSLWNRDGDSVGNNSGLTELGWRQAHLVADYLARHYQADALIASPLVRARQTAEMIGQRLGLPMCVLPDLEEAATPYWDELPASTDDPLAPWDVPWLPTPTTAPIYAVFRARVRRAVAQILAEHAGQTVIIVSHGGTIGTIMRSLFGGHYMAVLTDNAAFAHLTWQEGHWRLIEANNRTHLASLEPAPAAEPPSLPWGKDSRLQAIVDHFDRVASATDLAPVGSGRSDSVGSGRSDSVGSGRSDSVGSGRSDSVGSGRSPTEPTEPDLRGLIALAAPTPKDRVLDVATGAGAIALDFAPYVVEVIGVDVSPGMLERAEKRCLARNAANVHLGWAEASHLPFEPGSFDIVICHNLLPYSADPVALLTGLRQALTREGRLVLDEIAGHADPVKRATQDAIEARRAPVFLKTVSLADIERLLAAAGLRIVKAEPYDVRWQVGEWLAAAAADEATTVAVRAMLEASIEGDAAGLDVRRSRDGVLTFTQRRVRLLAVARDAKVA